MNLLAKGQALLVRLLMKDASPAGPVTFSRLPVDGAGVEIDLTGRCWVGRTVFSRVPTDGGPAIVFGERDYLVPVAVLGGPPGEHDRFTEAGVGTFEVLPEFGEDCWRYADPAHTIYRVHTKRRD
ncbi:MAG TPA: hypothetical protein VD866_31265 [Urbifossiella sp.]|nr:hypothetical protein [Urbifossiella sp.]